MVVELIERFRESAECLEYFSCLVGRAGLPNDRFSVSGKPEVEEPAALVFPLREAPKKPLPLGLGSEMPSKAAFKCLCPEQMLEGRSEVRDALCASLFSPSDCAGDGLRCAAAGSWCIRPMMNRVES